MEESVGVTPKCVDQKLRQALSFGDKERGMFGGVSVSGANNAGRRGEERWDDPMESNSTG